MLRRLLQLFIGLTLYGVSTAMFVRADLGADPWNVFHLGVANLLSMNIGVVIIAVGVLVLLAWIPLRQRPGFGTLSNVIMIGLAADAALLVIPGFESLLARSGLLVSAVILNALATSLYIGAGFGAGPRDGLMTGIHARTGFYQYDEFEPQLKCRCCLSVGCWEEQWGLVRCCMPWLSDRSFSFACRGFAISRRHVFASRIRLGRDRLLATKLNLD